MTRRYLAFDLGASSGRAILGTLEEGILSLEEIHRFETRAVETSGRLHWDVARLEAELGRALELLAATGRVPHSIGLDSWGVDFGLLGDDGALLGPPVAYRDPRHPPAARDFVERFGAERLFALTGLQFLPFNTLFQLHARVRRGDPELGAARRLLFLPDLLVRSLTGVEGTERTIASTSQLLDPATGAAVPELFQALGLPASLLGTVQEPGTPRGMLRPALARAAGLPPVPVTAVASHDTASAVAAVPAHEEDFVYVSSGTWSLMGFEADRPRLDDEARRLGFTNEAGAGGRVRVLKNLAGLWPLHACRRIWAAGGGAPAFETLEAEAAAAPAFAAVLDLDREEFLNPPDMARAVADFCRRTGQEVPPTRGGLVRSLLESLALSYRRVAEEIGRLRGAPPSRLHVIGGGSQNRLLCRFAAEATGLELHAGPAEAAAAGNVLVQAAADGGLAGLDAIRRVVRDSFAVEAIEPGGEGWDEAYERYRRVSES